MWYLFVLIYPGMRLWSGCNTLNDSFSKNLLIINRDWYQISILCIWSIKYKGIIVKSEIGSDFYWLINSVMFKRWLRLSLFVCTMISIVNVKWISVYYSKRYWSGLGSNMIALWLLFGLWIASWFDWVVTWNIGIYSVDKFVDRLGIDIKLK